MGRAFLIAVLFGLTACAPTMPEYDPGGSPDMALARLRAAPDTLLAIRGICFSACALKLAARRVCVAPDAQIGVHEVRQTPGGAEYEHGTRDELRTAFFASMLPACAHLLFVSLGGFTSGRLVTASGVEILGACPMVKSCG